MVKPDGVQRGLVGEIVSRFEKKGFHLQVGMMILRLYFYSGGLFLCKFELFLGNEAFQAFPRGSGGSLR